MAFDFSFSDILDGIVDFGGDVVDFGADLFDDLSFSDITNLLNSAGNFVGNNQGLISGLGGLLTAATGINDPQVQRVGYTKPIPRYTAVRERVGIPQDPNRRPGSGGRQYFSDVYYAKNEDAPVRSNLETAQQQAVAQAQQLAGLNSVRESQLREAEESRAASPVLPASLVTNHGPDVRGNTSPPPPKNPEFAYGGIAQMAKGRYLRGGTDGMEDRINTSIDGKQPAKLSHGEFVIPADVVSHLGNGNSEAGAKQLYAMMDRIRQARTGTKKQGRQVKAQKYLPA